MQEKSISHRPKIGGIGNYLRYSGDFHTTNIGENQLARDANILSHGKL